MKKFFPACVVLLSTTVFLGILVVWNPFSRTSDALDRAFHAPPKWTQVTNIYRNPQTQELSHGDSPIPSLKLLANYWHACPDARHVVFIGNSQMHTISLAASEHPDDTPGKTYVDLVADQLQAQHDNVLIYRLSAGNMSYPEVLWYLTYMSMHSDLRPSEVVLQMNFQALWQGGIRQSMLGMLDDSAFAQSIEALSQSGQPYADTFQQALAAYRQSHAGQTTADKSVQADNVAASFSPQNTAGYAIESGFRSLLNRAPHFNDRAALRSDFVDMMYRMRLYFLHLKPSTARSIGGSRRAENQAAIEEIARLCRSQHIELIMFHAPVNPKVKLYASLEDSQSYHDFVKSVAERFAVPLYDFECAVPAELWGQLLNGPDPLHMGRAAHQMIARQMAATIRRTELVTTESRSQ